MHRQAKVCVCLYVITHTHFCLAMYMYGMYSFSLLCSLPEMVAPRHCVNEAGVAFRNQGILCPCSYPRTQWMGWKWIVGIALLMEVKGGARIHMVVPTRWHERAKGSSWAGPAWSPLLCEVEMRGPRACDPCGVSQQTLGPGPGPSGSWGRAPEEM